MNSPEQDPPKPDDGRPGRRRLRLNGIHLFVILFIGLVAFSYRHSIVTVDCTPEIIASEPDVVMLGAWWCSYCQQAKRYFHYNEISYCEYDMEQDPVGIRLYEKNGGGPIPMLFIGEYTLRGFSERQVDTALALRDK